MQLVTVQEDVSQSLDQTESVPLSMMSNDENIELDPVLVPSWVNSICLREFVQHHEQGKAQRLEYAPYDIDDSSRVRLEELTLRMDDLHCMLSQNSDFMRVVLKLIAVFHDESAPVEVKNYIIKFVSSAYEFCTTEQNQLITHLVMQDKFFILMLSHPILYNGHANLLCQFWVYLYSRDCPTCLCSHATSFKWLFAP